ncbi:hypothetical protein RJ639_017930 [Escallonia herrerae]|uniref:E3 ubiquitin-protein ligase RHB1A n=1 Tax=Escallonia herrerae TaxID=1293975 RepID=A0AA89AJR1_9ASTE|nr:hypothetical protein RJ639_017930 [Escallonia herrerae]
MGGCCCCCSSKGVELNSSSPFYHIALSFLQYPSVSEEQEPLSSATASALSTGLLVDTNLETSVPDTYRPPPTPIPYDTNLGLPRTPPRNQESCGNKNEAAVQTTSAEAVEETNSLEETKDVKESDCKVQTNVELAATKELDDELEKSDEIKKSKEPIVLALEEEEVCPTCLEGNDFRFYQLIDTYLNTKISFLYFPNQSEELETRSASRQDAMAVDRVSMLLVICSISEETCANVFVARKAVLD